VDTSEALRVVRELSAAARAAAQGPWFVTHADAVGYMSASFITSMKTDAFPGANNVIAATYLAPDWATHPHEEANAAFIVAARNGVQVLTSLVEKLVSERRELREAVRGLLACTQPRAGGTPSERDRAVAEARRVLAASEGPTDT
jgi:hypothetical protein